MNKLILALVLIVSAQIGAESVDVSGVDTEQEGTTTIEIRKNKKSEPQAVNGAIWQVQEGNTTIEGDPAAMEKDARDSWKTACDRWEKKFRSDNKENRIINIVCGKATCAGEIGKKMCTSTASYTIKTKLN